VVKVAVPEFSVSVSRGTPLSQKVTVPVGVFPEPVTMAVKVTEFPKADELADEVKEVVLVSPVLMTSVSELEVLVWKAPSLL
jgi:hypothetical protein